MCRSGCRRRGLGSVQAWEPVWLIGERYRNGDPLPPIRDPAPRTPDPCRFPRLHQHQPSTPAPTPAHLSPACSPAPAPTLLTLTSTPTAAPAPAPALTPLSSQVLPTPVPFMAPVLPIFTGFPRNFLAACKQPRGFTCSRVSFSVAGKRRKNSQV